MFDVGGSEVIDGVAVAMFLAQCRVNMPSCSRVSRTSLARFSHTNKCIGAPNQRKFFCEKDFPEIRGRPDDDRL